MILDLQPHLGSAQFVAQLPEERQAPVTAIECLPLTIAHPHGGEAQGGRDPGSPPLIAQAGMAGDSIDEQFGGPHPISIVRDGMTCSKKVVVLQMRWNLIELFQCEYRASGALAC